MKITVLDGFTANPGDLDWKRLEAIGQLEVYDRTEVSEILSRAKDSEIIFTNKTPLSRDTLSSLPELKFIGVLATGYNVVDIPASKEFGITVCNVPSYSTMSVAQNVFALILDITNEVAHYTSEVKKGRWSQCDDFCFVDTPLSELAGKQLGIIGYGNIGRKVAEIGIAFGMTVAAVTSKPKEEIFPALKMDLKDLLSSSQIVSLHCPLTDQTYHLINEQTLSWMRHDAILINTGRGPLVDEEALSVALHHAKIRAAGIDVLSQEPPRSDNPLLKAPNVRITPHISWATKEARKRLIDVSISNLEAYLSGSPQNVVNG